MRKKSLKNACRSSQKALVKFHTVAFEGSIGLVNRLNAIRLNRKALKLDSALRSSSNTWLATRISHSRRSFPGHQNFADNLKKFMSEGGKVYCCRFALQALYGHGEPSILPGIIPIAPGCPGFEPNPRPRQCLHC